MSKTFAYDSALLSAVDSSSHKFLSLSAVVLSVSKSKDLKAEKKQKKND